MTDSPYDADPEALAWARAKIQHQVDRCRKFHASAMAAGKPEQAETWRHLANRMERDLIGGEGCTIAAFDVRRPALLKAIAAAEESTP